MPVPSSMADLSTTAASNSPAGSDSPTSGDDYLRSIQAIIRTTNAKGADIASATTTDIGAATGEFVDVTGTTTITGFGTIAAGIKRTVRFTGALTLTHNATSLILPSGASIVTANGDVAQFVSLGSGNWLCLGYVKASGVSLAIADGSITYAKIQDISATSRILGRKTAAAGDTEECTLSEILDFIGSAAQGDILYRGASAWARLGAGTSGQFLKTLGAGANPAWGDAPAITSGTVIATTSGTSHDFTGLPSTIKRLTVMLRDVSTNGSSLPLVRLGTSGGIVASGYQGANTNAVAGVATANLSSGITFDTSGAATYVKHGVIQFTNQYGNVWCFMGVISGSDSNRNSFIGGSVDLGGVLDRVRLTTVNGTDAFDGGSINIMYE